MFGDNGSGDIFLSLGVLVYVIVFLVGILVPFAIISMALSFKRISKDVREIKESLKKQ